MAKYFIQDETMINIADGIRNITGETSTYTGNQIKTELDNTITEINTQNELLNTILNKFKNEQEK